MDLPLPFHPPPGQSVRDVGSVHSDLIARTTDGCFVVDERGLFLRVDETMAHLLGHTVAEMIGRHTTDFVHPASRGLLRRQIERITSSDRRNYRLELIHRDGSVIPALISTITTYDDANGKVSGSAGFITDLRAVEALAAPHEAELRAILDNLQDTYYRTDASGKLLRLSASIQQLLGYRPDELIGTLAADLYVGGEATRNAFMNALAAAGGRLHGYEYSLRHKDGHEVWLSTNANYLRDPDGKPTGVEGTSRDISASRRQHSQLQLAATVFSESRDAIMITDGQRRVISVNRAYTHLTGYAAEEVIGTEAALIDASHHVPGFLDTVLNELAHTNHWNGEAWNRRSSGAIFPQWLSISTVRDNDGGILHYVAMFSDLTDRKAAEERAEFLARHDLLTRLPNRFLLRDRAEQAFAHAVRAETRVALLLLDLDHFKHINDSLGHPAGDALLQTFADRLRSTTRDTDTVSRQGGDEFLVLLTDIRDSDDIAPIVEKIMHTLARPCDLAGQEMSLSCSVGLAVYPEDGTDFDTLIRNADAAMYNAKESGRNTFRFYSQRMNEDAVQRLDIQNRLRRALERDEFILHYQPLIDLGDNRIVGAEALIRWNCPNLGMQPPGVFIPVAEDNGLIVEIGEWVLREACRQARAWQDAGHQRLVVAVNLSPLQFTRGNLVDIARMALADSGADPAMIELEITENVLVKDTEHVLATVRQLHAMGLRLAIDDFGTGYSSLAYLRRFAVDKLKIDQSFVRDLPTDPDAGAIVRAVIQMAKSLKIAVLAEGVETADIAHDLRLLGCDYAQGYYFGRPMPADAFADQLPPPH
ncbi:EAL domain-containing protein [Zoogloea sp.]|uniref:sensor domain-containing protein n=1 Tax=Zoogloea sp. TaxID=49181 RepID=UPI0035AF4182